MALEMFRSLSSLQMLERDIKNNLEIYRRGEFSEVLGSEPFAHNKFKHGFEFLK